MPSLLCASIGDLDGTFLLRTRKMAWSKKSHIWNVLQSMSACECVKDCSPFHVLYGWTNGIYAQYILCKEVARNLLCIQGTLPVMNTLEWRVFLMLRTLRRWMHQCSIHKNNLQRLLKIALQCMFSNRCMRIHKHVIFAHSHWSWLFAASLHRACLASTGHNIVRSVLKNWMPYSTQACSGPS